MPEIQHADLTGANLHPPKAHTHLQSEVTDLSPLTWEQFLDQSGASLNGLTARGGAWASDGTIIQQTEGTNGTKFLQVNEAVLSDSFAVVLETEFRVPSAGQAGGSNESLACVFHTAAVSGATNGAPLAGIRWDSGANDRAYWEEDEVVLIGATTTVDIPRDTWHTLRVLAQNGLYSVYLNGTFIDAKGISPEPHAYVGFVTQWALKVDFRNLKGWRLALPAQP